MDNKQAEGLIELRQAEVLYTHLAVLKEKNSGTPSGRQWAIAATECEKLCAWIQYVIEVQRPGYERVD
jgi:hypothetical protein